MSTLQELFNKAKGVQETSLWDLCAAAGYTTDRRYRPGEISEKTGLQKQPDGSWKEPKHAAAESKSPAMAMSTNKSVSQSKTAKGSAEKKERNAAKRNAEQKQYKERPEISACKTAEEVQDVMKQQDWFLIEEDIDYNNLINIKEAHPECAKSIFNAFDRFFKTYPKLKGKFTGIIMADIPPKDGKDVYSDCNSENGGIRINSRFYKDFESLQEQRNEEIEGGWAPEGTSAKSIIVHELGHALCGYFAKKHKMTLELFCEKIQDKVLTLTGLTINDVPKGLSKYATENSKEFCSEAFCEYFEIENPRPIAAAFGKIIEKEFI